MSLRRIDPGVRTAALASAGAHLVYGGVDVLLAGAAFCMVWRLGMSKISEENMNDSIEDGGIDERLLRVAARARAQSEPEARVDDAPSEAAPVTDDAQAAPKRMDEGAALLAAVGRIDNLCREIPMPPFRFDPAACADAMLGFTMPTSRTLSAFRRARAESSYGELWAAEVHAGETMIDTMTRVIAEGMPRPEAMGIVCGPGLEQMRAEFDALPSDERADEIQRHVWAMQDPGRVRTRFSSLLSAIGIS